ncbi:MAG: tRNA pseudouridine(55) synthase TruB [Candidatus Aminicenantes bacterium]|nr:MAG: tRNA pseudouridine(55) synthase TruB [Candidatus Aminicenantes bacterium]
MDGLILVNKHRGKTSHDIVACIRRILATKKVGHFGTLDPLATGLLLVAVGKATRLFPFYLHSAKTYRGRIKLGITTDTYDSEGKPVSRESKKYPDEKYLLEYMKTFQGEIVQVPPPYSAKKYKGEALYKRVRKNKEYILKPNKIFIHYFRLKNYCRPYMDFDVKCSSGTYIRSLAHDLGQKLGCGAHLEQLERTEIGEYRISKSHTLENIEKMFSLGQTSKFLQPIEDLLPELPKIVVNKNTAKLVRSGSDFYPDSIPVPFCPDEKASFQHEKQPAIFRIFDTREKLLAFATKKTENNSLHPFLVFDPENSSS